MSHLIRVLFALQVCIMLVAGCAVEDDVDTESTDTSDVADPAVAEATATPDVPDVALENALTTESVTAQAICTRYRLNNRATLATCRSTCASHGQNALGFDNAAKICRCCGVGPL